MMALDEEAEIMDRFNELRTLGILMRNYDGNLDTEDVAGVGEIIFDLIRDIPALVDRIDAETRRKKAGEKAIREAGSSSGSHAGAHRGAFRRCGSFNGN